MTQLTKPVSRRTTLMLDNRIQARSRDSITVTLYPCGDIGFRPHKCRKETRLSLVVAYALALRQEGEEIQKNKDQERRLRKGLPPRKIKVRRSSIAF